LRGGSKSNGGVWASVRRQCRENFFNLGPLHTPANTCTPFSRIKDTMAKAKTSSGVKPLTERPLDLVYYIFFAVHILIAIGVDDLPLWPEQLTKVPGLKQIHGFLSSAIEDYTKKTNDPFMLATRGLVQREWEFAFLNAFMWMEL
jgi:hypothetical protein